MSYVTPALSAQVALASQSNPTLANLLNAVINRTATDDQVKTLGLLVQSMGNVQQLGPSQPSSTALPTDTRAGSPKPFDIVLEFHERPADRWIFPRGDVVCERRGVAQDLFARSSDVTITTSLPFAGTASQDPSAADDQQAELQPPEVGSLCFSRVPQHLWDLFMLWAGGPAKVEESRTALAELVSICLGFALTQADRALTGQEGGTPLVFAASPPRRRAAQRSTGCECHSKRSSAALIPNDRRLPRPTQ